LEQNFLVNVLPDMFGLICPGCSRRIELFCAGGGKKQAEEMNIARRFCEL